MFTRSTENTMRICKQCISSIARGDDCIACEGFCGNVYHIKCVNLSCEDLKEYLEKSNMWWICDPCMQQIRGIRNDRLPQKNDNHQASPLPDSVEAKLSYDVEILEMKKQISAIQDTLRNCTIIESAADNQSLRISSVEPPGAQSSPMSSSSLSSRLLCGTRSSSNPNTSVASGVLDDKCWLFFTRLKNHVTEHDIAKMVADNLGPDVAAVVRKLVPMWKDPSSLPYISFKVGIEARLKGLALRTSTWPTGTYFREFHTYLWEP